MTSDTQTAALSPEEWQGHFERQRGVTDGALLVRVADPEMWILAEERPAIAARAMEGQPWGFSAEDVAAIQWAADGCELATDESLGQHDEIDAAKIDRLRSLASRLSALLPPRP